MEHKLRLPQDGVPGQVTLGGGERLGVRKVLAYGLLPPNPKRQSCVYETAQFDIHDVPLGHPDSFLEFDGVITFAGIFEKGSPKQMGMFYRGGPPPWMLQCVNAEELGRRLRESHSLLERGCYLVFLVPWLSDEKNCETDVARPDLFRCLMHDFGFALEPMSMAIGNAACLVPEFAPYVERHGAARVQCIPPANPPFHLTEICRGTRAATGFVVNDNLFVLPCHVPTTHDSALDMADLAAAGVIAYRERVAVQLPVWVNEFRFARESQLADQAARLKEQLTGVEANLSVYLRFKRVLVAKSTPLVDDVISLLSEVFGLSVRRDERCIEDACLVGADGPAEAVIEIKGANGSFKRADVHQVDGHRERLNLPHQTPGLLIMNTMVKAGSLNEKDDAPHRDIIAAARADNVLLIRALDLLRYADLIEQDKRSKGDFRNDILTNSGWLKVGNDRAEIVKE